MLAWLSENLINITLIAALALIIGLLIRGMIRDRKARKTSCGACCAECPMHGNCHSSSKS